MELITNKTYPSKILGLDISTTCIGASIIIDDGVNQPKIEKITHIVPKVSSKIKGIEALILRKKIFEDEFLSTLVDSGITECIIEAPLIFAVGNSNPTTVAQLLKFNALLSEGVYNKLGIIPFYMSSLEARIYALPEILGIRKFNKHGMEYKLSHIMNDIKKNHLVAFADYPYDCDKKNVVMNLICEKYPEIQWVYNKKGEFKKENFDACDSLVCALAYSNLKRFGEIDYRVTNYDVENAENEYIVNYTMSVWDEEIDRSLVIPNLKEIEVEEMIINNEIEG
jgi:hypothetical protein